MASQSIPVDYYWKFKEFFRFEFDNVSRIYNLAGLLPFESMWFSIYPFMFDHEFMMVRFHFFCSLIFFILCIDA